MIQAISIVGKMKTGKTTVALSAPKPLVMFDFELGFERVEPRFIQERDKIKLIPYVKEALQIKGKKVLTAEEFWGRILHDYNEALQNPDVKTIVFDTFSSVWEARRMAYLAELQRHDPSRKTITPPEYFIPNTDMKMLLTQARLHNKILIVTHHTREKYVEGRPSGEEEPDGFKYTGDLVDVEIWMKKRDNKPIGEIRVCGLSMSVEGMEIAEITYDMLDNLVTSRRSVMK